MRTIKSIILIVTILFSTNIVSAQFGNNNMGGNGMNQRGNGMSQMGAMSQPSEPEKPKEIPPEEIVANYMAEMKKALTLDELQSLAITNLLVESVKSHGRISKLNLSQEDEIAEYKLQAESTDKKVTNFLNKDQKEKYIIFKEDFKKPKKSKSKEKKK